MLPWMSRIGRSRDSERLGFYTCWDYTSYDSNGEPLLLKSQRGLNAPELQQEFEGTSGRTMNASVNLFMLKILVLKNILAGGTALPALTLIRTGTPIT